MPTRSSLTLVTSANKVARDSCTSISEDELMTGLLRGREVTLRMFLETAKIIFWEAELETWEFTYVSEHAKSILGYPTSKWYHPGFLFAHLHPDDQPQVFRRRQVEVGDQSEMTFRLIAKDSRVVWLKNFMTVTSGGTRGKQISGFMVDISEQKRAEEALRDLGGRLIAAQEQERSRIARELHDDFNQRLALLSIELTQLGAMVDDQELQQSCRNLQKQAEEISGDIHRLSHRLHPTKLDHLGLVAAVRSLCEEHSRRAGLNIDFQQKGYCSNLPKDMELCLFRIAQEALRNCVKHSGARSIQVLLSKNADALSLSVSDDGCGFDQGSQSSESGLGFISMRERLHLVGGELHVYSKPLRGTRIQVSVPLN